jgi:hypothetical protein
LPALHLYEIGTKRIARDPLKLSDDVRLCLKANLLTCGSRNISAEEAWKSFVRTSHWHTKGLGFIGLCFSANDAREG